MGGGPHRLAVGRPLRLDGLPLAAGDRSPSATARSCSCWPSPSFSAAPASASACSARATRSWRATPPSGSPSSLPGCQRPREPDHAAAPPLLRRRADRRLPRSDRRDRGDCSTRSRARRARPSRPGRRSDRGDLPLRRPHRVPRSRDRAPPRRRPRRAVSRRLSGRLAALRDRLSLLCRRLDWTFLDPPHRPAGDRAAAGAPRAARRPPGASAALPERARHERLPFAFAYPPVLLSR